MKIFYLINYFIGFSQLGIPIYGIRKCAQVREDQDRLIQTIHELLIINMVFVLISYLILFFCSIIIFKIRQEYVLYFVLSTIILLQALGIEWYYKAIEEYVYITVRSIISMIISIVLLFLFVKNENDYLIYALIIVVSRAFSELLNFIQARKIIFNRPKKKYHFKPHFKPILIIFAISMAASIYSNFDTIMLGFMMNDKAVGIYTTAIKVKTILVGIVTSGAAVLLPRVSNYLKNQKLTDYLLLCQKTFRFILVFSFPVTVYFCFFSYECISILAGEKYLEATIPMIILMPTVMIIAFTHNMGIEMLMSAGKEIVVLYAAIGGAIIDFLINICLIPTYGVIGASIGTLIAELVVFVIEFLYMNKIDYMRGAMKGLPWFKTGVSVSISIIFSFWIKYFNISIWNKLIISGLVYCFIFLLLEIVLKEPIVLEIIDIIRFKILKIPNKKVK